MARKLITSDEVRGGSELGGCIMGLNKRDTRLIHRVRAAIATVLIRAIMFYFLQKVATCFGQ